MLSKLTLGHANAIRILYCGITFNPLDGEFIVKNMKKASVFATIAPVFDMSLFRKQWLSMNFDYDFTDVCS